MKDREVIERFLNSIKEELLLYSDSLSEKTFPYIDKLKKEYNHWEKDLQKIDGTYVKKIKHNDDKKEDIIQESIIDEKLDNAINEYASYINYKEEYSTSGSQNTLTMAYQELEHFLENLCDVFKELDEFSKNEMTERALIKGKIKNIYQSFS